jgi:transcriptional regulator with XRE-family HTH domain
LTSDGLKRSSRERVVYGFDRGSHLGGIEAEDAHALYLRGIEIEQSRVSRGRIDKEMGGWVDERERETGFPHQLPQHAGVQALGLAHSAAFIWGRGAHQAVFIGWMSVLHLTKSDDTHKVGYPQAAPEGTTSRLGGEAVPDGPDKPGADREMAVSHLGSRVRAARDRLGWSREALAFKSGLSWSAVEQIESGRRRNARPDTLEALARALGVTIDYLVHGGEPIFMLGHQMLIFQDDDSFLGEAGSFLEMGAKRSEALMAVASAENNALLRDHLGDNARRVKFVDAETWYSSPTEAIKAFQAFTDEEVSRGAPWSRIVGEPLWRDRSQEEIQLWTRYEAMMNLTMRGRPVTVLCSYNEQTVGPAIMEAARRTHPKIVDRGETTDSPSYQDPGDFLLGSGA